MSRRENALLVLAGGEVFEGEAIGVHPGSGVTTGEIVFNTSLSGYQEIITDPSYAGQVIAFTYPHIGNYGSCREDEESSRPWCQGIVVRSLTPRPSSWRSERSLEHVMISHRLAGISGVDTRRLTRLVREHGSMGCAFGPADRKTLGEAAEGEPGTTGRDLVSQVTTTEPYRVGNGALNVVAYDFGIKVTMLKCLGEIATVTVVPSSYPASETLALRPDGVMLSNGPGDPSALPGPASIVSDLLGRVPLFGICLGHQLLAEALGATTYKLPFGHHGANHPVRKVGSARVEITSQNHNYAVDRDSLEALTGEVAAEVTHVNLNDQVVEGLRCTRMPAFGIQFHPEAGPGPHDARSVFEEFRIMMTDPSKLVA